MRSPGTLRAEGISSIAVDKPTRARLKQLAGDMPVSHYLRALTERELAKTGKGRALPGTELLVSGATLPAIAEGVNKLAVTLDAFVSVLSEGRLGIVGVSGGESQLSLDMRHIFNAVEASVSKLARSVEADASLLTQQRGDSAS